MGNCCLKQCCASLLSKDKGQGWRVHCGGGSKYFRTHLRGQRLTPEYECLVQCDEGDNPGNSYRILTDEEIVDLRTRDYHAIAEKQKDLDTKIQRELSFQEEKLRLEEEASYTAQREAARTAKQRIRLEPGKHNILQWFHPNSGDYQNLGSEDNFDSWLSDMKTNYEVFHGSKLSSDFTVLTPNTKTNCDLMTITKLTSGNPDSTSLDLELADKEGMNRMFLMREQYSMEEDILSPALKSSGRKTGSNPSSVSVHPYELEWENDLISANMDDNGNSSECSRFMNPL